MKYFKCVLEEGKYIPLLNDPKIITNEYLIKLKRATSSSKGLFPKIPSKSSKQSNRTRSLRSLFLAASLLKRSDH